MTPWPVRDWWPLAWVAAFAADVVAAVVAAVERNGFALFGWACAGLGALGAAGAGALLAHTHREIGSWAAAVRVEQRRQDEARGHGPDPLPRHDPNPPGLDDWNGH